MQDHEDSNSGETDSQDVVGSEGEIMLVGASRQQDEPVKRSTSKLGAMREALGTKEATLAQSKVDLVSLHAVLSPGSVVDMTEVYYSDYAQVDSFLRLSGFDTDNPIDIQRLRQLHMEASEYLAEVHNYRIPEDVQYPEKIHDLFLIASQGRSQVPREGNYLKVPFSDSPLTVSAGLVPVDNSVDFVGDNFVVSEL